MLKINNTTLVCIDCIDVDRAIRSIEFSLEQCAFDKVLLLTSIDTNYKYALKIPPIKTIEEYSIFCINELYKFIDTKYMITVQYDGWIVDASKWRDEFYDYDYIGGICNWIDGEGKGGNGGVSFRSKKLMEECSNIIPTKWCHPEDVAISSKFQNQLVNVTIVTGYRKILEDKGFKFATREIQKHFSFDGGLYNNTFAHHKGDIINACKILKINKDKYAMNIEIINAQYGSESNHINVTDILKKENGTIVVSNTFFQNDPHFGTPKRLKIKYRKDGKIINTIFCENDIVDLNVVVNPSENSKIYDCFTFFNEYELLGIRLNEMFDIVEKFVIVEANRTHTGIPKDSNFLKNKHLYAKFLHKIEYKFIEFPYDSFEDTWKMENYQRDFILNILKELRVDNDSLIIVSDCDEIPCQKSILRHIQEGTFSKSKLIGLSQPKYNYKFNLLGNEYWDKGYIIPYGRINEPLTAMRLASKDYSINCGWHFSWIGGDSKIEEKIKSFAHNELNNVDTIKRIIKNSKDNIYINGYDLKKVNIDETFPKYLVENISKFKEFISI